MKLIKLLNFGDVTDAEMSTYKVRDAARAVIFDEQGNIALMKISKDNFYKLPGGGIEKDEERIDALERECMEEAGVKISAPVELGIVREIKNESKTIQNSYCYVTHTNSKKVISQLTNDESARGFEVVWIPFEEAVRLIQNTGYSTPAGKYVFERELAILQEAKNNKSM